MSHSWILEINSKFSEIENNLKNEDNLKNKDNLKNEDTLKKYSFWQNFLLAYLRGILWQKWV